MSSSWDLTCPNFKLVAAAGQVLGRSGFTARYDWEGVYALAASRQPRDVRGQALGVRFEIIDKRLRSGVPGSAAYNRSRGPYTIAVSLQVCLSPMPDSDASPAH